MHCNPQLTCARYAARVNQLVDGVEQEDAHGQKQQRGQRPDDIYDYDTYQE